MKSLEKNRACPVPSLSLPGFWQKNSDCPVPRSGFWQALPARPLPSSPVARFWACPVVPLSRDNEGTSVPLSRKIALSRPVGKASWHHPFVTNNYPSFRHSTQNQVFILTLDFLYFAKIRLEITNIWLGVSGNLSEREWWCQNGSKVVPRV